MDQNAPEQNTPHKTIRVIDNFDIWNAHQWFPPEDHKSITGDQWLVRNFNGTVIGSIPIRPGDWILERPTDIPPVFEGVQMVYQDRFAAKFTMLPAPIEFSTTPFPPVFGLEAKYFQFLGRNVNVVCSVMNWSTKLQVSDRTYTTASGMFGFAHDGKACCVESGKDQPIAFFQPQDILSIEFA